MVLDLVADNKVGAGVAGADDGELVAERGQGLGAPRAVSGSNRISSWPGQMSPEVARASRMSAYASLRAGA